MHVVGDTVQHDDISGTKNRRSAVPPGQVALRLSKRPRPRRVGGEGTNVSESFCEQTGAVKEIS